MAVLPKEQSEYDAKSAEEKIVEIRKMVADYDWTRKIQSDHLWTEGLKKELERELEKVKVAKEVLVKDLSNPATVNDSESLRWLRYLQGCQETMESIISLWNLPSRLDLAEAEIVELSKPKEEVK